MEINKNNSLEEQKKNKLTMNNMIYKYNKLFLNHFNYAWICDFKSFLQVLISDFSISIF